VSHGEISSARDSRRVFRFAGAAVSHSGAVREHNEDYVFCGHNLIAVADGVGGNVFGEVASEIVTTAIAYLDDRVYKFRPDEELREAVEYANFRLLGAIEQNRDLLGMATTLTALRLDGESVVVLNVGDSRAYGVRNRVWQRLTRDDSFVQDLVDAGQLTDDEALRHPARSVVMQALSGGAFRPTVEIREAAAGDRYLVCSDGLTDYVAEDQIGATLVGAASPGECCQALVEAALAVGAPDNVSCAVADVYPLSDA
jgi:serine/threonine protein phosphatase PrpC